MHAYAKSRAGHARQCGFDDGNGAGVGAVAQAALFIAVDAQRQLQCSDGGCNRAVADAAAQPGLPVGIVPVQFDTLALRAVEQAVAFITQ